jgi:RNA polymerase sigma-70 factor (ECF subfamily)
MTRLRAGDQEAATAVFSRFSRRLIGLARRHLDGRLRDKLDPEDVMQSVFRSFFAAQAEKEFDLENWDNLWSLLVVITLRKCGHKIAYFCAARRDVQREQMPPAVDESIAEWEAIAQDPTPSHAMMLADAVELIMNRLESPRERQILELSLQGCTPVEISARVGRTERTVQRVLARVRKWLERMRDEAAGTS